MATFTLTAGELADAAESNLLWTDQDVQRGIQPTASPVPPREISLASGYPDDKYYVFDTKNADDMTEKLLHGGKLFLNPLVWNLRPGSFKAYRDNAKQALYIYEGRIYLPDSHHRHQAIFKAVRTCREAPKDYPAFSEDLQFKVELYFLNREDEGNYFFDKNQRPKPTAKSKAFDLTTMDDLSILAKKVIERSTALHGNVNRVTDRLTRTNPQVVTLSTLREMMKTFAPSDELDSSELEGTAAVAAQFFDLLAAVRPELGTLTVPERRSVRESLVVDAAVIMHGYAGLMKEFNRDMVKMGPSRATTVWSQKLRRLAPNVTYTYGRWRGDIFAKNNPLWQSVGIVSPSTSGKLSISNTGSARAQAGSVLRALLSPVQRPTDLRRLAR